MRTSISAFGSAAVGLAVVLVSLPAHADDLSGMYNVKYEETSTNCQSPLRYAPGKLEIKLHGTSLTVDIDRTPLMQGSLGKNGKLSAKSKSGKTMLDGMDGVFSVAGTVDAEGAL